MHRLAVGAFAGFAALAGCLREKVSFCKNGAYCPEPLACTERATEPFCGTGQEVNVCVGKADETACETTEVANGYCFERVCTPCHPNFSFCRYTEWTAMSPVINNTPVMTELRSVWGVGPKDLYVVGRTGTIIHWNGREWSALPSVAADADYESIWGADATNVYAVTVQNTGGTRLFRFDGSAWQPQSAPAGVMNAVWGASASALFVVGTNGEVGRYDGAWGYSTPTTFTLNGVWGMDASNAVAVGNNGTAIRYTNGWAPESTGTMYQLRDVGGAGATEFAVGRAPVKAPIVLRHQSGAWTDMTPMLPAIGAFDLFGVWAVSPTDVYAVGEGGTILHYDGAAWTSMSSGVGTTILNEIFATTTDAFVVGASGTILRRSL